MLCNAFSHPVLSQQHHILRLLLLRCLSGVTCTSGTMLSTLSGAILTNLVISQNSDTIVRSVQTPKVHTIAIPDDTNIIRAPAPQKPPHRPRHSPRSFIFNRGSASSQISVVLVLLSNRSQVNLRSSHNSAVFWRRIILPELTCI